MTGLGALRTSIPGRWGPLQIAATGRGVVAVAWLTTAPAFEAALEHRLREPVRDAAGVPLEDSRHAHLRAAIVALEAMLAGGPPRSVVQFDLADRPTWDRHVLEAVAAIPWGRTASYGEIARQVGVPRAARAVGGAVGRNPISLLIPCHRVIAADGTLGGYGSDGWGSEAERLAMKRDLLMQEGVATRPPIG